MRYPGTRLRSILGLLVVVVLAGGTAQAKKDPAAAAGAVKQAVDSSSLIQWQRRAQELQAKSMQLQATVATQAAQLDARHQCAVNWAWYIMVGWFGLVVLYLVWAVNRYSHNYGLSNREWKVLYPEVYETWFDRFLYELIGKKFGMKSFTDRGTELSAHRDTIQRQQQDRLDDQGITPSSTPRPIPFAEPGSNPYEKDSFGLPPGTIRGILALTALVMFLAMEGLNLYAPTSVEDQFKSLITALEMVLAFYFGSRAVEVLQKRSADANAAAQAAPIPAATGPSDTLDRPAQLSAAPNAPPPASPEPPPTPSAPVAEEALLPSSVAETRFANFTALGAEPASAAQTPAGTLAATDLLGKRVLAMTSSFESGGGFPACFGGLAGNFDGQGISFGALQWNIGRGTVQPLWRAMRDRHPDDLRTVLGDKYDEFCKMLDGSKDDQMRWALELQHRSTAGANAWVIVDPWKTALRTLGRLPSMIDIQVERASSYYQVALSLCREYSLNSERGVALMFDIRVQNGSVDKNGSGAKILADMKLINATFTTEQREVERMRIIARRRAEVASALWRKDVLARKMTIAEGTGTVHGRPYDLASKFFLTLSPVPELASPSTASV